MDKEFLKTWQELETVDLRQSVKVIGLSSGVCENCNCILKDSKATVCPGCNANFKYCTFRDEVTKDPSFYKKLKEFSQSAICIDYADYKKLLGKIKAKDIFK